MSQEYIDRAQSVIASIILEDYYVELWNEVKPKKALNEFTKTELFKHFQDFWDLLPDSKSIRRPPFFQICDLAEEYCFGGDGEDDQSPAF